MYRIDNDNLKDRIKNFEKQVEDDAKQIETMIQELQELREENKKLKDQITRLQATQVDQDGIVYGAVYRANTVRIQLLYGLYFCAR